MPPFQDTGGLLNLSDDNSSSAPPNTEAVNPGGVIIPQGNQAHMSPTMSQTMGNVVTYGLPGIGAGIIDTLGQSLGVFHNNTVSNFINSIAGEGQNSFGDFYTRNKPALRTTGEIATMALPGLAAMKILKTVNGARELGTFGAALKNSTAMDILLGNSADMALKEKAVGDVARAAQLDQGYFAGRTLNIPAVNAAKRSYYAARAVEAVRTTTAFELGSRAAFNSSNTFYPADYTVTDQLKWSVAGLGLGVGLEMAQARYAVRGIVQNAINSMNNSAAFSLGTLQKDASNVIFRPNERGVGVTAYASMKADLQDTIKVANSQTLKTNLAQDQVNFDATLSKQIGEMGRDPHPILKQANLSNEQIALGLKALSQNQTTFTFATKLGNLPEDGMGEFYNGIAEVVDKAKKDVDTATLLTTGIGNASAANFAALQKAQENLNKIQEAANEMHYVIEPDGTSLIYKSRASNWLDDHSLDEIKRKPYTSDTTKIDPATGKFIKMKNSKLLVKGDNELVLHDDFRAELPPNPTPKDFSAIYAAGSKMIDKWRPVENQELILTPGMDWHQQEGIVALTEAKPEALGYVKLGNNAVNLTVARKLPDGSIKIGSPGQIHADLLKPAELNQQFNLQDTSMGFATPSGKFLSRTEAADYVKTNQPSVPSIFTSSKNGLEATTYNKGKPLEKISGYSSIADAKFNILNQKVKEFMKLMPDTGTVALDPKTLAARFVPKFTPAQVIQRLNLPTANGSQQQPLIEMIAHMKLQGMTDLNEMFPVKSDTLTPATHNQWDLLQAHLRETAGIDDGKTIVATQGNLLNQAALADTKPIFVAAKSTPYITRSDSMIGQRVQAMRDVQLERLAKIDPNAYPLVSGVLNKIVNASGDPSGAANVARGVQTLQDGVLSGTGQLVFSDRINEQFPTLKAMQALAQDTDTIINNHVTNLTQKSVLPQFAEIVKPQNKNDLFDFNRVEQAYRHGWEITGIEKSPDGNGSMVFKLKQDSKINQQLTKLHFPEEDVVPDYLPDMSVTAKKNGYSPLQVSGNAASFANSISQLSIQSGHENNALRIALGKNPIQLRDFHLPTPELSREGTYFVKNSSGRVMATYSEPGNFTNNKVRAQAAADTLTKQTGEMHIALPLDTIRAEHQINDENFFDLIDMSDQLAKTGVGIQGGLAHTTIDTGMNTAKAMIQSLEQQFRNVGIRSRAAVFEPELNYARQAAQSAKAQGANKNAGGINIFDRYISTMFSQSPNNPTEGFIGKVYTSAQGTFDNALSWLNGHFSEVTNAPGNSNPAVDAMRSVLKLQTPSEEFAAFEKHLPKWSPFQETSDWAESTFKQRNQWTSKPIAATLSRVSSTMSMRLADVGTAINNFAGLMTNAPSVVTALRQLPNEAKDVWLSRTAAWGSNIADGVVTFSPLKAMNTSIKALWSGELNGPMGEAAKHGYFLPEYASIAKALSTPATPGMASLEKWIGKATYLADHSEMLSRQIAWGMGYKIGKDLHKFDDERNAYIFANDFVNSMIGNYSPNNKPAMFQGALGLPLGAFQTYMFNFYRRMYGMIERGDKSAFLAQYAAQASIFGAKSVPGYSAWNSMFQSTGHGSDDFTGRVNSNLPPGVGELLLNGSLDNIPKIFGAGDGFAFHTRGSVDYTQPIPTLLSISKAPPLQFLSETYGGIKATVNNFFGPGGFSLQQQEEIMANFSTNRALKSIMEMAANAKTDQQGAVVVAGTRDAIHLAAGLLGTRPASTQQIMDAANAERTIQLQQEDLRTTLNMKTRAILRGGEITVEALQDITNDYLRMGGNPQYMGQWFRDNLMTATTPKIQLQLEKLGKSGKFQEFQDMLSAIQQNQTPNNAINNK